MIEELNLWAAQDALLAALKLQETFVAAEVPVELGFPASIQPDHVWINGEARGLVTSDLAGPVPSNETFRMSVFVFVQRADDYSALRDQLKVYVRSVEDALSSAGFAAVVPAWSIPEYTLDAGTDGTNRQLCIELTVECQCW